MIPDRFRYGMSLLRFLHSPLVTLHLRVQCLQGSGILYRVRTGFSFRTETFNPMRDPILESCKRRSKFISEARPAHIPVSARLVLFFFEFLLSFWGLSTQLSFVRARVRLETLSCKHGTKFCFSLRIELDQVCEHTLELALIGFRRTGPRRITNIRNIPCTI